MPSVTLNHSLRERYLADLSAKFLPDRVWDADAVHRSDLIYCLRKAWARYNGKAPAHPEKTMMNFLRGRILHEMLAVGDAEHEVVDGALVLHVDDVVDGEWVEKKTTIMKYAEPPKIYEPDGSYSAWGLEMVTAAYYAPGHKVNMMVMHLMGDYGQTRSPMLSGPWEYAFTQAEVDSAHTWITGRRDVLVTAMETGTVPGYEHRMAWECKDCPLFGTLCDAAEMGTPLPLPR